MYKVLCFIPKADSHSLSEFKEYYEEEYVPFVISFGGPLLVYKRYYLDKTQPLHGDASGFEFDAITEMAWPDKASYEAWIKKFRESSEMKPRESKFLKFEQVKVFEVDENITVETKSKDLAAKGNVLSDCNVFFGLPGS